MTYAATVKNLLENPSTSAVNLLFCQVSVEKALSTCTDGELKLGNQLQDIAWLDARNNERTTRQKALLKHIGNDKISRELADKIDAWANKNPYVRPVNQPLIDTITDQLTKAKDKVFVAYQWRDRLHADDRFGWDYKIDAEDAEYSQMLEAMSVAELAKQDLEHRLRLAAAGFGLL